MYVQCVLVVRNMSPPFLWAVGVQVLTALRSLQVQDNCLSSVQSLRHLLSLNCLAEVGMLFTHSVQRIRPLSVVHSLLGACLNACSHSLA